MVPRSLFLAVLSALGTLTATALAQCEPQWLPGDPSAVTVDVVPTFSGDPDGTGPEPLLLFGRGTSGAMAFDGTRWRSFGTPPYDVTPIALFNGQLVGSSSQALWTWNGSAWQNIGAHNGSVSITTVFQGALIVGGGFSSIGGVPAANIARWDGVSWSALGSGTNGPVRGLAVFSGVLNVGGSFGLAGGVGVGNLAAWDGSGWIARPVFDNAIYALAVRSGTTAASSWLFAGGAFQNVGTVAARFVARCNASTNAWTAMGGPTLPQSVGRLCVRGTGITSFEVGAGLTVGNSQDLVWRWTGSAWAPLGSLQMTGGVAALLLHNGQYVTATAPLLMGPLRFDGSAWQRLVGLGIDSSVHALLTTASDVVIGGSFRTISGTTCNGIARGSSGSWAPLGTGFDGNVYALARMPNGDVIAGGSFTTAGGTAADNIARWNGSSWSRLGLGLSADVRALLVLPDGTLIAAGLFTVAGGTSANRIARWNGLSWAPMGSGFGAATDIVMALARLSNGDIVAGGGFLTAGSVVANNVARWDGNAWSAMGTGFDRSVSALAALPGGDLVAGGAITMAGTVAVPNVARWNGTSWSALPATNTLGSLVSSLAILPDGGVVAGSYYQPFRLARLTGGTDVTPVARLQGSRWESLSIDGSTVYALATTSGSDLLAGGTFVRAGGRDCGNFARRSPTCPALATPYGTACVGSAGPLNLTVRDLPWIGSTYRGATTGIPANGLAFDLLGFTAASTPLSLLHPLGNPACSMLVTPVATQLVVPTAGVVTSMLSLPRNPVYLGAVLRNQTLVIELGPAGIAGIHASNALQLTVGSL